jgi:hypothetical protein
MINGIFKQPEDQPPLCAPPSWMPTKLGDVTLVLIETMFHDLAWEAVRESAKRVAFHDIVICSDKSPPFDINAKVIHIEHQPGIENFGRATWHGPWIEHVQTSHMLLSHWDSWVIDPGMWSDDFLQYDFIGAPWWYEINNVGCGAFTLRSMKMVRFLNDHRDVYPHKMPDDVVLCQHYRARLEAEGFRWAPDDVAMRFAFECSRPHGGPSRHFGFHEVRNFPLVMQRDALIERVRMLLRHDQYLRDRGKLWQLWEAAPWLERLCA